MRLCLLTILLCLFPCLAVDLVSAQEMKIHTHIFHVTPTNSGQMEAEERAVSLTIFHAGRAYDYIDSVKEVIIFEPKQNRFTILNYSRSLITTVNFDELRQILKVARHETEQYLEQLADKNGGQLPESAKSVFSQLEPDFAEDWDSQTNELSLHNASIRYTASCVEADDISIHEAYLSYADWMARLNFVLHPQTLFPEARLKLNESLRKRKMYPTQVRLFRDSEERSHLRAEHRIRNTLDSTDRMMITEWESLIQKGKLKQVTFQEYQEAILITHR
ncbi:MAG: hypothetical protein HUJ26_15135 [Planctomycetaceae bacterium]|nr:hypothetical protein [Planctomycetaceae bacterium]